MEKGYYWHKDSGKWMVRIEYKRKTLYLGLFEKDKEQEAAQCYLEALEKIKQEELCQRPAELAAAVGIPEPVVKVGKEPPVPATKVDKFEATKMQ